jgi:sialidase-1
MPRHALALLASLSFAFSATLSAAEVARVNVFEAGKDGYWTYRIPGLVVTQKGTLLAYCEARTATRGDWGPYQIVLRRSTDGGKTWSDQRVAATLDIPIDENPAAVTKKLAQPGTLYNNPVLIPDVKPGVVHMLFCAEYHRAFYQRSDDDGVTFGKPVEITAAFEAFRPEYDWKIIATGPCHGIRLKAGRLVVPVWMSRGTGIHAHRPSVVSTIVSDDDGTTWRRGEIVANETDPLTDPNETIAVELSDGRVMLNIRSESKANRRAVSISPDGATKWTKPAFDDALFEPICMASLVRTASGKLIFSNPDSRTKGGKPITPGTSADRQNLTIRLSDDDGKTWAASRVLEPGVAGYSDLAVGADGKTIYCLFEGGRAAFSPGALVLVTFDEAWIRGGGAK